MGGDVQEGSVIVVVAFIGFLIALAVFVWVVRLVIGAVVAVVGLCLALAVAAGAGMAVAMLATLVGEAAQWREPGAVGALLGVLAFLGVLALIARRVFRAEEARPAGLRRSLLQTAPEPEPEPEEPDPAVRAAWQRAAAIAPRHAGRLRTARRDCAALLALAEGSGAAGDALDGRSLDPEVIDLAVMARRNVPALVQRVDALWQGAEAAERDALAQGLADDLERIGQAAAALLARRRAALRDQLDAVRRHVAARTAGAAS